MQTHQSERQQQQSYKRKSKRIEKKTIKKKPRVERLMDSIKYFKAEQMDTLWWMDTKEEEEEETMAEKRSHLHQLLLNRKAIKSTVIECYLLVFRWQI